MINDEGEINYEFFIYRIPGILMFFLYFSIFQFPLLLIRIDLMNEQLKQT